MSFTLEQEAEIRELLQNRWPSEQWGIRDQTWSEWRKSLQRFDYRDVMLAVFELSETEARFPALARLMGVAREHEHQRLRGLRGLEAPAPHRVTTVEQRLAEFDRGAEEGRAERHAEWAVFARRQDLNTEETTAGHARIDVIGPHEVKAREVVARGLDPGKAALAHVQAFVEASRWSTKNQQRDEEQPPADTEPTGVVSVATQTQEGVPSGEIGRSTNFNPEAVADEWRRFPDSWSAERVAALSNEQRAAVRKRLGLT
jgi:hypothetical protein